MKKVKNKNFLIIFICLIAILLIIIGVLFFHSMDSDKSADDEFDGYNYYKFSDEVVDLPGTLTRTNDNLKKEQCVDEICVSNVTIYYIKQSGRIECNVTNHSKKKSTGYLKLNFGENSLIIFYKDLKSGKSTLATSYYDNISLGNVNDYKLEALSDSEIDKIIKK